MNTDKTAVTGERNAARFGYKVEAVEASRFAVTRHGIRTSKGGQFVASERFVWPDTPVWMAETEMRERFPACDIQVQYSKAMIEFSQRDQ